MRVAPRRFCPILVRDCAELCSYWCIPWAMCHASGTRAPSEWPIRYCATADSERMGREATHVRATAQLATVMADPNLTTWAAASPGNQAPCLAAFNICF